MEVLTLTNELNRSTDFTIWLDTPIKLE